MAIKHAKTSAIEDGSDATLVRPSDWNADHTGTLDHGTDLAGLSDDDHPQYIKHSLATAINDFLVASGAGAFVKKTLAEVKTILGLGTAAYTAATDYVTHALATAANDFLVASGSGAFVKKTLAEVKTLLDWAADIATHAGLTTGVHGVGANYVAQAPAASHLVRSFTKGWTSGYFLKGAEVGANPEEVFLPEFTRAWFHEQWGTDPASAISGWTDAVVNSGNIYYWGLGRLGLSTGATVNSAIKLYTAYSGYFSTGSRHVCAWFTQWADTDRTNSTALLLVHTATGWPTPSLTEHHVGFEVLNGAIRSTSGDGSTREVQETGITYANQWALHKLAFIFRSGAIDFYVDDVLKTTHSTNLPTISNGYMYLSLSNQVAADRKLDITGINMRCA